MVVHFQDHLPQFVDMPDKLRILLLKGSHVVCFPVSSTPGSVPEARKLGYSGWNSIEISVSLSAISKRNKNEDTDALFGALLFCRRVYSRSRA